MAFGGRDVFLNVAGGLRINEPAADLAVAAALISSMSGKPLPRQSVVFGEISLSGAVRPVSQSDLRLKEAAKLGFQQAFAPKPAMRPCRLRKSEIWPPYRRAGRLTKRPVRRLMIG